MSTHPPVVGHRGMSSLAPENTMASFAACIDHGVTSFEFDVDIMGDGTLIVIHDNTLDRTTTGSGSYYDKSFSDLRALDAGQWFSSTYRFERVPELASVIELMNRANLDSNLEIKPCEGGTELRQSLVEGVAVSLRELDAERAIIVSSFDMELLAGMKEVAPHIPRACLFAWDDSPLDEQVDAWIEQATTLSATAIHPQNKELTRTHVERMTESGFKVNVWTVNDLNRAAELGQWGVNSVISDIAQDFPAESRAARPFA
ncbi:MAG: glycerophosphoryl diester phosphodiesterase [Actinomycetaceae bacterium]|nr:glycerophosphoryl diester phosphodiesterase [Actinomycetaceae bacterium]